MQSKSTSRGCFPVLAFLFLGAALTALVFYYAFRDLEGVAVAVEAPAEVTVGDTFQLRITVTNERPRGNLRLSDIDIAELYLDGFSILSTEPMAKSTQHVPIDNSLSHKFDLVIPAGESKNFLFLLRAERPGDFLGDIDICEGLRFITAEIETLVHPRE